MEMIRVGLVGAGTNSRRTHIPQLQKLDHVVLSAVSNSSPASSAAVADEFGIQRTFDSWEVLIQSDCVDAVVIGTYPDLHESVAAAALHHGKHVLVEARMARDAYEARRMFNLAAERPELVAMLVPSPIAFEIDPYVDHLIASGAIGRLLAVNAHMNQSSFLGHSPTPAWRRQRQRVGANIMELGILYETLVRWTGPATEVLAAAAVHRDIIDDAGGAQEATDIPDHLNVLFSFGEVGRAALQFSSVTGLAPSPTAWLFGTEGTIRIDLVTQRLEIGDRKAGLRELTVPERWRAERTTAADFVAAICGEGPVTRATFAEGVRYMELVDAVGESIRLGKAISV